MSEKKMPDVMWVDKNIPEKEMNNMCESIYLRNNGVQYIRADLIKALIEKWNSINPQYYNRTRIECVEDLQNLIDKARGKDG